jgi:phosphoglycerate dehydrogenase-like enzyme
MTKKKAALFYDYPLTDGEVFGQGRREKIAALTDLYAHVINAGNFDVHADKLADIEVIFGTWGIPEFSEHHYARMPKLKAVFYAAGNVKKIAQSLLDRNVLLMSAWGVNAIPVAEMCLSQMLLSLRGYFRAVRNYRQTRTHDAKVFDRPGAMDETIGLIGLGHIGTRVVELLRPFPVRVIAHDPFITPERAQKLGVTSVALDALFREAFIVSNHIPDLDWTRGTLNRSLFESMRDGATFINTGRGAQVIEADLIAVLKSRPDLTALLDVTWPEPPVRDSALWHLPNVVISPHIGGTIGNEVVRLADCAIEEFQAWEAGRSLRYQVTPEVFRTMG